LLRHSFSRCTITEDIVVFGKYFNFSFPSNLNVVGVRKAREIAGEFQLPIVGVHHMEAHTLVARYLSNFCKPPSPPKENKKRKKEKVQKRVAEHL